MRLPTTPTLLVILPSTFPLYCHYRCLSPLPLSLLSTIIVVASLRYCPLPLSLSLLSTAIAATAAAIVALRHHCHCSPLPLSLSLLSAIASCYPLLPLLLLSVATAAATAAALRYRLLPLLSDNILLSTSEFSPWSPSHTLLLKVKNILIF